MAIPPMEQNLRELLLALNRHHVRYVVIGGYAVFVHAQPRMTKDLDVFIESTPQNALATYNALAEFGAPLADFTVEDFNTPTVCARFGNPPYCLTFCNRLPVSISQLSTGMGMSYSSTAISPRATSLLKTSLQISSLRVDPRISLMLLQCVRLKRKVEAAIAP